jgi:FlaA1/EpsC-like NDP-sugar epimerase
VPITYWFVAFTYLMTSRFVARSILQKGIRRSGRPAVRALVYGAGQVGVQLVRAMSISAEYVPVCFADDDVRLRKRFVSGLRVFGPEDLPRVIATSDIHMIVLALPSTPAAVRRRLIERLEGLGVPVKTVPALLNLVDGNADIRAIRDVDIEDLLGRDPVAPDPELFARNLRDKVVMVTGAGGSIGSELCRQILSQAPRKLVLFDHSEYLLYAAAQTLRVPAGGVPLVTVLGSVLDAPLVTATLRSHGVDTVYHAAAYKHVPIVEDNPRQGVVNNVFGTSCLVNAVRECQVEAFVLISTDKAVRPTNVMGATKRVAELVVQAAALRADCGTVFSMVRFGNVLGSSGSVVPLFKQQLQAGGPITITHADVIRYFMLIPEAAQLVIQAGALARGGEVFVLDMGEPVRIADLARTMIQLSGLTERTTDQLDGDIAIEYVGLRPGEKLYEELLIGDDAEPSAHPRILFAHERYVDPSLLDKMLDALRTACAQGERKAIVRQLRNLVPEFVPSEEPAAAAGVAQSAVRR